MPNRSISGVVMALAIALTLSLVAGGDAIAQQKTPKLFKIITAKDEVVVGLADDELRSFGAKPDLDNLAEHLAAAGQMTVWQFAIKKDADGALVQAPLRRVAIFKTDTLRIEPYNPAPAKVLPLE
jgi:hypothetical protein